MPVGVHLEGPSRLYYGKIVTRSANKLHPDGEIFVGESARNGHRRQPAHIADAAERIGKSQAGLKV